MTVLHLVVCLDPLDPCDHGQLEQNHDRFRRVLGVIPRLRVDGDPHKHEAASPARATASTTLGPIAEDPGGCCHDGNQ